MSKQELEALARRLEIEARKHTGDLNADLHKAAQIVLNVARAMIMFEVVA